MFALLMIAAVPAPAQTQAPAAPPLVLETQVLAEARQAAADGTTLVVLVAPGRIGPGDRVVVQVSYRNAGTQPLAGLVIANPVPGGLAYRGGAAGSVAPELSVDGERFAALDALRVAAPGGTRVARPDDVRQVRWRVPGTLAAGAAGRFAFQAVVR